jgi:hypothetical protein
LQILHPFIIGVLKECIEIESEKSIKDRFVEKKRKNMEKEKEKNISAPILSKSTTNLPEKNKNGKEKNNGDKNSNTSLRTSLNGTSSRENVPRSNSCSNLVSPTISPLTFGMRSPSLEESLSTLHPSVYEEMRRNEMMEERMKEVFFFFYNVKVFTRFLLLIFKKKHYFFQNQEEE